MLGKINLALVPMRKMNSETSEMTSQLLFGEELAILEIRENWYFVRNLSDNYEGWVTGKMVEVIANSVNEKPHSDQFLMVIVPVTEIVNIENNTKISLPGGSLIQNTSDNLITIGKEKYRFNNSEICKTPIKSASTIISFSKQYINSPYLWGGKSIFGIDCSGFVQVVFSMCGIQLPRDASQQAECGTIIDFLTEAQEGDIAFFTNSEGKIIHVGILLSTSQIIHASGWVKIENIDASGIISIQTGAYSHYIKTIKRLF